MCLSKTNCNNNVAKMVLMAEVSLRYVQHRPRFSYMDDVNVVMFFTEMMVGFHNSDDVRAAQQCVAMISREMMIRIHNSV